MTTQNTSKHFLPAAQQSAHRLFAPVQREFDKLFDQLGEAWGTFAELPLDTRLDVRNTKEGLEITLEAPGVDQKDIKITVEDHVLTISGEKKASKQQIEGDYRVSERAFGSFSRSITLPRSVDPERVTASMHSGVLTLTASRDGQIEPKRIEIKTAK
jgi:HSP20 family protein